MIKGEVVDVQLDENGNIKVLTDYTDEKGVLIQEGATRYSLGVLPDLEDIKALIQKDVDDHCQALLRRKFGRDENAKQLMDLKNSIVGLSAEHSETTIQTAKNIVTIEDGAITNVEARKIE